MSTPQLWLATSYDGEQEYFCSYAQAAQFDCYGEPMLVCNERFDSDYEPAYLQLEPATNIIRGSFNA